MSRALVTGINSFIGSWLAEKLLESKFGVKFGKKDYRVFGSSPSE
ncbi:MAG: hypothetical protein QMD21_01575 [Candidatus Thermoplasmatota archaeon]|nr:hypothetical protein [Candidatus Thermoplasmatota archaeon]